MIGNIASQVLSTTGGLVRDVLTGTNGRTYAPARLYWCLASLTQIGLSVWTAVYLSQPFNSTDFGTGMGLVLTAGSFGVWATQKTEPSQ